MATATETAIETATVMETVTEKELMEEVSGEVDGGCGLETKRRRRLKLSNDALEELEDAADAVASMGEGSRSVCLGEEQGSNFFSSDTALISTETEFFVTEKKLENGNSAFTGILDDVQIVPEAGEIQDPNHIKLGNEPNSHIDSIENGEVVVIAATEPETQSHEQSGIAKMVKLDVSELDLEKVLEEQETHDLFCPNCQSCITKRVILRKRKRRVQDFQYEERPEKLHIKHNIVTTSTEVVETSHGDEPDVFRCLSCFSFFIPTENGFNIFRIFRKREESVDTQVPNLQSSGQTSTGDGNRLSAIFKPESSRNKGNEAEAAQLPPKIEISFGGDHKLEENQSIAALPVSVGVKVEESYASNVKINSASQFPVELKVSSGGDSLLNENKSAPALPLSEAANAGESYATYLKIKSDDGDIKPVIISKPAISRGIDQNNLDVVGVMPPASVVLTHDDMIKPIGIVEPSSSQGTSEDLSIGVSAAPSTVHLPLGDVHIDVGNQILVETRRENEWEVLKSIVYGGLIESITSLGVVSSAAGAETKTLNVVALGLANLIGGFFLILHDLSELKSSAAANQKDEQDGRYWRLLGRKSNFGLHATVAVMSYILFGLLPPVIYGFSFRETDQKEYKLIAVAASSLLCIAILAIGKAYVGEPKSYIKTFLYYLGIGFTVSGLSYVAGAMIDRFLEQLGLFEHNAPLPSPPSLHLFGVSSGLTSMAAE